MKHRKVSRGRRVSIGKGIRNRNGSGNSKFKTRHRKMRGGAGSVQVYDCKDDDSHVGGPYANYLDMHAAEKSAASTPNITPIKENNHTHVNTVYVGNMMKMGIFNRRSTLKRIFSRQHKHLINIGLIQVIKNVQSCSDGPECSHQFYGSDNEIIHDETTYGFLGQFDDKGEKNGLGLCYDMSDPNRGRIFIGYWNNGLMNGLGIEVDFMHDAPNNTYKLVGIYYGHFRDGKRSGFGIYYKFDTSDASETFFHTADGGHCTLKDKSYTSLPNEDVLKKKFELQCKVSLNIDSRTPLDVYEFKDFFFTQLTSVIEGASTKVSITHGPSEHAIFKRYVAIYTKFVGFCREKLEKALREYYEKANKDEIYKKQQAIIKAEQLSTAKSLQTLGYVTGKVVDPDALKESEDKEKECVTLLTNASYVIQTPEEIKKNDEAQQKAKLEEHETLVAAKERLNELERELTFLNSALGHRENTRRSKASESPISEDTSPVSRLFGRSHRRSFDRRLFASPGSNRSRRSQRSSDGGGSLTRKNRRTGKRSMRRKSRRHLRHHRHHHHHHH